MRLEFTCVCIPFCSDYSVKSSQLLYILLYHLEDHVTHQLQSVLTGLYHSAQDDEQVVVKQVRPLHYKDILQIVTICVDCAVFRTHWVLC